MGRARGRTKTNNTMGNLQTPATWGGLGQDKNKQHNGQSTDTSNMRRASGRTKTNNTMGNLQTPAAWGGLEAGQK